MDPTAIQKLKNDFALSRSPPIEACTNSSCKFTECVCGNECGCNVQNGTGVSCDPCVEFKKEMMEKKKGSQNCCTLNE